MVEPLTEMGKKHISGGNMKNSDSSHSLRNILQNASMYVLISAK